MNKLYSCFYLLALIFFLSNPTSLLCSENSGSSSSEQSEQHSHSSRILLTMCGGLFGTITGKAIAHIFMCMRPRLSNQMLYFIGIRDANRLYDYHVIWLLTAFGLVAGSTFTWFFLNVMQSINSISTDTSQNGTSNSI